MWAVRLNNGTLDDQLDTWSPRLRKAFLDALYIIKDAAQIDIIAEMLLRHDIDGAIKAVGLDPLAFSGFETAIAETFAAGGNFEAARIPAVREPSGHVLKVLFDIRNPSAEAWLKDYSSQAVVEIVDDQRKGIRAFLTDGMSKGLNPKTVALDLVGRVSPVTGKREGGIVGLTSQQEEWSRNYAAELAKSNPNALTRNLRDKRFDAAVNRAIASGQPIPAGTQTKMVTAYRNRALRYRAETIGRTEALTSLHQGSHTAMLQGIAKGQVKVENVSKIWRSAHDDRVRDTHRALNGMKVKFSADFVSPSGARLAYPGDPSAPAAERIACRCWCEYRVNHFAGLK